MDVTGLFYGLLRTRGITIGEGMVRFLYDDGTLRAVPLVGLNDIEVSIVSDLLAVWQRSLISIDPS